MAKQNNKTKPLVRHKTGPKTEYDPALTPMLCYRLALLGLRNNEIAATLQIKLSTFTLWINQYDALKQKLNEGRRIADGQVAQALFKRATGFTVEDTFITLHNGKPVTVPTEKYYPPDTTAAIFWLKSRTRDNENPFVERQDVKLTKEEKVTLDLMNTDLSGYTDEELKVLNKLTKSLPKPEQEDE